jgi:hypothetical protein
VCFSLCLCLSPTLTLNLSRQNHTLVSQTQQRPPHLNEPHRRSLSSHARHVVDSHKLFFRRDPHFMNETSLPLITKLISSAQRSVRFPGDHLSPDQTIQQIATKLSRNIVPSTTLGRLKRFISSPPRCPPRHIFLSTVSPISSVSLQSNRLLH